MAQSWDVLGIFLGCTWVLGNPGILRQGGGGGRSLNPGGNSGILQHGSILGSSWDVLGYYRESYDTQTRWGDHYLGIILGCTWVLGKGIDRCQSIEVGKAILGWYLELLYYTMLLGIP